MTGVQTCALPISNSALEGNVVDGGCTSITIGGTARTPSVTAPSGNRLIRSPLGGDYYIGTDGDYASFTDFCVDLNSLGLNANTNLYVISDITEPGPVVFNRWIESAGSNYTLTIQPDGAGDYTITGNNVTNGVFNFNGTRNVVIDGGPNMDLTFMNNSTSTCYGILLDNGATYTTIRNCNITTTSGAQYLYGIYLRNVGNNNTTIANNFIDCNANARSGNYGIVAEGGSNENLTISYNTITDTYYGIRLYNYFNSTYYPGNRNANINYNLITDVYYGMYLYTYTAQQSYMTINNNYVGARGYGIYYYNYNSTLPTTDNLNIYNNEVYCTGSYGIYSSCNGLSYNINVLDNDVNRATSYGMYVYGYGYAADNVTNVNVSNNFVGPIGTDIFNASKGLYVYMYQANGVQVKNNEVKNISHTGASTVVGLELGGNALNAQVMNNIVSGISNTYASGGAWGLSILGGTGVLVANNVVSNIKSVNYSPTDITYNPFGIRISSGTNHKVLYNTVSLYGAQNNVGTAGSMPAAFCVTTSAVTGMTVKNNIFSNSMTGLTGTRSYAIYAPLGTTFTDINYNDYWASGTSGVLEYFCSHATT